VLIWYELTDITAIKSDVEQLSDMRRDVQVLLSNQQLLLQLLNQTGLYHRRKALKIVIISLREQMKTIIKCTFKNSTSTFLSAASKKNIVFKDNNNYTGIKAQSLRAFVG